MTLRSITSFPRYVAVRFTLLAYYFGLLGIQMGALNAIFHPERDACELYTYSLSVCAICFFIALFLDILFELVDRIRR